MSNFDRYQCTVCKEFLPRESFEPYRLGKKCRKCRNTERAALRMSTPERYINSTISRVKLRCKENDIEFGLTYQHLLDIWNKQEQKCFYTDKKLSIERFRSSKDESPSLDRVIPSKGYVDGNVVWCINRVNRIKNNVSLDEMKEWMPEWYRRITDEF